MDYREKYLNLKQYIFENNQRGSGKMNPIFIDHLSNLSFVIGDNVLGDDVHAVILSLIEEFNRIATIDLKHNLELSQYYAVGSGLTNKEGILVCENCEIVLKYIDTTVCITNGRVLQHVIEDGDKYYHVNKMGDKTLIKCVISRGLIRFYLKQKDGNNFKYMKIDTVNVQKVDSLHPFFDTIYQNSDEINKLENASDVAINKGQSDAILSISKNGHLETNTPNEIMHTTKTVNNIITEAKNAVIQSQLRKMNNQRIISTIPTQSAVNAANTVAKSILSTNAAKSGNMIAIMVPNNEPTLLQSDINVDTVSAIIDDNGIVPKTSRTGTNTMNSKIVNNRSSLAVDANVAVIPTKNVISDEKITITPASQKSTTSVTNKLAIAVKDIVNKTENVVDNISNKVKHLVNGNQSIASVVPISKNLSVMTPLTHDKAEFYVPVPTNEPKISHLSQSAIKTLSTSQRTAFKRYENKLMRANSSNIPLNQTNQVSRIASNGNSSVKRTQEINHHGQNMFLDRQFINSPQRANISLTSNRTIVKPSQNTTMIDSIGISNKYAKLTQNIDLSDNNIL